MAAERLAGLEREVGEAKGEAVAATAVAEERQRDVEALQEKLESAQEVGKGWQQRCQETVSTFAP